MATAKQWKGPKSHCRCGHTGDGDNSQHVADTRYGLTFEGKGSCAVPGCGCQTFTWVGWLPEYERHLNTTRT